MQPKRIEPEQQLDFWVTPRERDLIVERTSTEVRVPTSIAPDTKAIAV